MELANDINMMSLTDKKRAISVSLTFRKLGKMRSLICAVLGNWDDEILISAVLGNGV